MLAIAINPGIKKNALLLYIISVFNVSESVCIYLTYCWH